MTTGNDVVMRKRAAPAKVNLYLHVAAPDARGYHPLQSLVVFADVGDEVTLLAGEGRPRLSIDGPFGAGLSTGEDNLILRAVRAFEAAASMRVDRHDIHLSKNLPLASGIGGGSADAGAVLHLLREAYAPDMDDATLSQIAGRTGSDGVMCLWARSAVCEGYGEILRPVSVPPLHAVLINPGVECPTAAVYRGFDSLGRFETIEASGPFDSAATIDRFIANLNATRNDLQAPAIAIQPVIGEVLRILEAQPETLLARMSGSGATCFALCADALSAQALGRRVEAMWPAAWVVPCRLG